MCEVISSFGQTDSIEGLGAGIYYSDGAGVSQQQLVDQAVRVAKSYARTHGVPMRSFHMTPPLWMAAGSAVIGAVWAMVALL